MTRLGGERQRVVLERRKVAKNDGGDGISSPRFTRFAARRFAFRYSDAVNAILYWTRYTHRSVIEGALPDDQRPLKVEMEGA